jgi:adenosylcobinamide-GDP ribazoletransferase
LSGLAGAISFLTRVSVGKGARDLSGAARWFPWVGAFIGLFLAGIYSIAYRWMPSPLAAVMAVAAGVLLTGALHEDGFADTSDAIGSGAKGEEALRILRDSNVGTYGAVAVTISVLWRVFALASMTPVWALGGLVLAHTVGRAAAVLLTAIARPARRDGLGRSAALEISGLDAVVVTVSALAIGGLAGGVWAIPVIALSALSVWWWRRVAIRRIGGITGDVLGACEQVVEMLTLATIAVATWGGSSPWWV